MFHPKKMQLFLILLLFNIVTSEKPYRVVVVEAPPFIIYDKEQKVWTGYCLDLLKEMQKVEPFNFTLIVLPDEHSVDLEDVGNWTGPVLKLIEEKADVAVNALTVMSEKEDVIDFTDSINNVGIGIMVKRKEKYNGFFLFFGVMEFTVWVVILIAYIGASFLLWFYERFSPYSYRNIKDKESHDQIKRLEFKLKECFWFCWKSLTPQGGGETPINMSGQILVTFWWFFGFILLASYNANLSAFLTISQIEREILSLDDLIKQNEYEFGPIRNSFEFIYFERMKNIENQFYRKWQEISLRNNLTIEEKKEVTTWEYPLSKKFTKLFRHISKIALPKTMEEVLQRIRSDNDTYKFAYFGNTIEIAHITSKHCDMKIIGEPFSIRPIAFGLQKDSPIKDKLNRALTILRNRRIIENLEKKWWDNQKCSYSQDNNRISIQIVGGLFIVLLTGIILSYVTLAFEYIIYRRQLKI